MEWTVLYDEATGLWELWRRNGIYPAAMSPRKQDIEDLLDAMGAR